MSEEVCTLCSPGSESAPLPSGEWGGCGQLQLLVWGGSGDIAEEEEACPFICSLIRLHLVVQKDSTGAKERGHPGPGPPRRLFCGVPEGLIDFLGMVCPPSSTQYPVSQETSPWDMKPWLLVLGTEGWVKGSTKPVRWSLPPNRGWKQHHFSVSWVLCGLFAFCASCHSCADRWWHRNLQVTVNRHHCCITCLGRFKCVVKGGATQALRIRCWLLVTCVLCVEIVLVKVLK